MANDAVGWSAGYPPGVATADDDLTRLVGACRAKLEAHRADEAATVIRNEVIRSLWAQGMTRDEVSRAVWARLAAEGFTDEDIKILGLSSGNIRNITRSGQSG